MTLIATWCELSALFSAWNTLPKLPDPNIFLLMLYYSFNSYTPAFDGRLVAMDGLAVTGFVDSTVVDCLDERHPIIFITNKIIKISINALNYFE